MKDLLITTPNPTAFDQTMQSFGAALIETAPGRYLQQEGGYVLRVLNDPDYVLFVIQTQGYGTVIRELEAESK